MKKAEEETQVESEENVLYEGNNSDVERLPVGKAKKKQKRTKKAESSTSRSYVIKQSKNDIEEGENNQSEEEEGDRKLSKNKMDKGLESKSEGDEQLKKLTKLKKGKGSKAEKPYLTCNTRSSPKSMYEAMMTLTDPQKKCLKDMGFERMIHFSIVELPSALAYHATDHFHPGSMELRLEKGFIKATRQKVHDMLGIPMGAGTAIASVISDTTEADFMFRMNFITLFRSTMGTLDNGGRVPTKLLKRIIKDVDISDIDWCGYILDCLQTSKKNWKDVKTRNNFYYGPLTFLCFDPEEEQDGMNVYKGLDVYVPSINDKEPETKEIDKQIKESGSEGTKESGSKGTEENESEATEEGSDGKEENMNGDEREVTTQMDVDNQNKELNKEKDANETEDNDKMNNNDMKNDSVQENQDTDKDENAKVDNVEEKQSNHKDEID
ncbi:hypothetical protein Tco_1198107 [Tanacetum coccineum]